MRLTLFADDAVGHIHDVAGDIAREGHFMRYDDHRQPLFGQPAHNIKHFTDHLRIERARRLVKQQHFRLHGERAGDGHTLLLPAGELGRPCVDIRRHADLRQVLHGGLLGLLTAALERRDLPGDAVVERGHIVEQVEALEHHANLRAVLDEVKVLGRDVLPMVEHLAGGRRLKQVDAAQHRALAGAGRADNAHDLALFHAEVDVAQDGMVAELLLQMYQLDHIVCHGSALLRDMDLGIDVRLRAEDRVVFVAVQLPLDPAQQARDGEREDEIQDADDKIRLERLEILALDDAGKIVQLCHADDVQDGRILDVDDKLIADRWQDIAHDLRDDDLEHGLCVRHSDGHGALKLAAVDGNDAAADDLGHVRAGVDGHDEDAGRDERQRVAAGRESIAPVNNHRLHHHRRATEDLDIDCNDRIEQLVQRAQDGVLGHRRRAHDAGQQTKCKAGHRTRQRDEHRVANAGQQLGVILDEDVQDIV